MINGNYIVSQVKLTTCILSAWMYIVSLLKIIVMVTPQGLSVDLFKNDTLGVSKKLGLY